MGGLTQAGPQGGLKGQPVAGPTAGGKAFSKATGRAVPFWTWFSQFLLQELKPYPGRVNLVARYTIAATLTMLVIMTFRVPGAAVGGFFVFLLPRDAPSTTLRSGLSILMAFAVGLGYVLLGAMLFVNYPLTHFLWVMVGFFLGFYVLSIITNYGVSSAFLILIVLAVPVWDTQVPTAEIVVANLWTAGSVALAIFSTLVTEYAFSLFKTKDELREGLAERIEAVGTLLEQSANGALDPAVESKVTQFGVVGVSRLRRLALGRNDSRHEIARMSTAVSLVGRLVDITATQRHLDRMSADDLPRLAALGGRLCELEARLKARNRHRDLPARHDEGQGDKPSRTDGPAVLLDLEHTVELLAISVNPEPGQEFSLDGASVAPPPTFVSDAWTNPEHLNFGLRGGFAAMACYFIFTAVAWPGLSTSLLTCVVTAVTSIGTSRQKQLLRVSGALCGGLILGMGAQVFVLPMLDGIVGFMVLFVAVTMAAAWFTTASPRLSYFGAQMGLAFYLVHLAGPGPQTNLAVARNNVMGILLGLVAMWVVFDTMGSKPAVQVMRELFAANLRLMAQLTKPWPDGKPADLVKIRTLRDRISQNFAAVNAQADAVLFEVGRGRSRKLALRDKLLGWQPQLRSLFLLEVSLLQYRLQVSPEKLPERVLEAQTALDHETAAMLEELADSFQRRRSPELRASLEQRYGDLERAIAESYHEHRPARAQAILALSSHLVLVAQTLTNEMDEDAAA